MTAAGKTRAILAVAALTLTLATGPQAEATTPNTSFEVSFGSCDVLASFGTYGNAYAKITEFSTSNCGNQTWVQAWQSFGNPPNIGAGPWCKFAYRLAGNNPYPGLCVYNGSTAMAVLGGIGIGMHIKLCAPNGVCSNEYNFHIWDGLNGASIALVEEGT